MNLRLTGLRGVGKTVLLKEVERRATENGGWLVSRVQLEPRHNTEGDIVALIASLVDAAVARASRAAQLKATFGKAITAVRGLARVSFEDFEFSLSGAARQTTHLAESLLRATQAADEHGYEGYLVMLDEAQVIRDDRDRDGEHPLSMLIAAVNGLQEQGLPIGLVLCGLPTLKSNLLKARTYSERMFRGEEVGGLDHSGDAIAAFVKPLDGTGVSAVDALVTEVVAGVEGYPYFIQLWGAELWDAMTQSGSSTFTVDLLEQVQPDIYRRLDLDFYDTRVESLTPAEQDVLITAATCPYPPLRTADIRQRSPKSQGNVNVLMGRLTDQGVLFRSQNGIYEFTAPKFHDYLQRRRARTTTS